MIRSVLNLLNIKNSINRKRVRVFTVILVFFFIVIGVSSFYNVNFLKIAKESEIIKLLGKAEVCDQ